jgi:hypothetical protein
VEGLATGQADRNGDGVVTVDELYDFVYDHVRGKVAGQTPGRWVNLEGELAVARNPRPPVHAAVLPAELLRAVESDVALHRLGAVWQLGEWLDQGEPGQQLTAREVLERLTQDYDQRVRTAASSILTGPTVAEPLPAPSPEEPALAATATATAPAADPVTEPGSPIPPVPPASATAAAGQAPDRPLKVTAVAATRTPTEVERTDGRLRLIGWLALTALIASAVAAFLPFIQKDGYTVVRLIEENWYDLWLLSVGGLAVWAAVSLLGQGRDRGPGIAVVLGLAPVAVASGLGLSSWIAGTAESDSGLAGPGYVIALIGRVALTVAAVLAATRAREYLPLAPPPAPRAAGVTALAALIGTGAALGLGALTVNDYLRSGLDLPGSLLGKFALSLLLLTAIACVLSGWLADHRVRGRLRVVGTVLLYAFVVVLFVNAADPTDGSDALYLGWYAAMVVGAMVVPVVSTLVLPRRQGAILLGAWTAGMVAEAGYDLWHGDHTAGRLVLGLSLVGATALAAALWTGRVDRLTGNPSPDGAQRLTR